VTWQLWAALGLGIGLVVYLVLRFLVIWFVLGGNDGGNYYSDSDK
jgi:hypothetical protein